MPDSETLAAAVTLGSLPIAEIRRGQRSEDTGIGAPTLPPVFATGSIRQATRSNETEIGGSYVGIFDQVPARIRRETFEVSNGPIQISEARSVDEIGAFVLVALLEGRVTLTALEANLDGHIGWMAVGRLMRAGLVDDDRQQVYLTRRGQVVAAAVRDMVASRGRP